jgi:hypothetical protein
MASVCKHVKEAEKKYIKIEYVVDNILRNFVMNLGSSDSYSDIKWEEEDKNKMNGILPLPLNSKLRNNESR